MRQIILACLIIAATAYIYNEPETPDACLTQHYKAARSIPDQLIADGCGSSGDASMRELDLMRRNGV